MSAGGRNAQRGKGRLSMKLRTSIHILGVIGLAQLMAYGCSAGSNENQDQSSAASGANKVKVIEWDSDGVPSFVIGDLGAAPSAHTMAPDAVMAPLKALTPTFHAKMDNLVLKNTQKDSLGDTHYRYRETRDGLEVLGA